MPGRTAPKLLALPLALEERDGLETALAKAGLRTDDVRSEGALFWRFITADDVPAGFGGLEMLGREALLRSVLVLPPLRGMHVGAAIVALLETEARARNARAVWLVTENAALFFERLGYSACPMTRVPAAVRATPEFRPTAGVAATVMSKRLR